MFCEGAIELAVLTIAGLLAGYVNTIAGAGSLLTLPALIFTGLDAGSANATNRIAVVFQSLSAIVAFRRGGLRAIRPALVLSLPATLAAIAGAFVASRLDDAELRPLISIAMVVFLVLSFVPLRRPEHASTAVTDLLRMPSLGVVLGFVGIGFYVGFLQAGAGILILLYLAHVGRMHLVAANAIKVIAVLCFSSASLATFVWQSTPIDPARGLVLAASSMVGAYLGAAATLRRGEAFIRVLLVLTVVASAIRLLF